MIVVEAGIDNGYYDAIASRGDVPGAGSIDLGKPIKAAETWIVGSCGHFGFGIESENIVRFGIQYIWILFVKINGILDRYVARELDYF